MDGKKFVIEQDGSEIPVVYTDAALEEFEKTGAPHMDQQIKLLSDTHYGQSFYLKRTNRLGIIASLIFDAVGSRDQKRIVLCVLWLATRFPEVSGVEIENNSVQFLWEDEWEGDENWAATHDTGSTYLH